MIRLPEKIGIYGWLGILLIVLGIDIPVIIYNELEQRAATIENRDPFLIKTLSEWCWEAVEHPIKRVIVFISMIVLFKHLAAPKILRRYDPIGVVSLTVRMAIRRGR